MRRTHSRLSAPTRGGVKIACRFTIKRRADVVAIFPNEAAIVQLVGALLLKQNDEWAASRVRYMSLETLAQFGDDPQAKPKRVEAA